MDTNDSMAKFINTRKAVSEIEDLIKNAGEKLILVSPYLKLSKDFKELLTYRNSKDRITTVIFGKQELNPDEMKFLSKNKLLSVTISDTLIFLTASLNLPGTTGTISCIEMLSDFLT